MTAFFEMALAVGPCAVLACYSGHSWDDLQLIYSQYSCITEDEVAGTSEKDGEEDDRVGGLDPFAPGVSLAFFDGFFSNPVYSVLQCLNLDVKADNIDGWDLNATALMGMFPDEVVLGSDPFSEFFMKECKYS